MKIISTILILALFFICAGFAQQKQIVYFLKDNGKEVSTKDSADFIRIIHERDSVGANFRLLEYYSSGEKKVEGVVSAFIPVLVYENQCLNFYKNGKKASLLNYKKGKLIGLSYYYFDNGKAKEVVEYEDNPSNDIFLKDDLNPQNKKVLYLADSLGKVMVNEGNGYAVEETKQSDGTLFIEKGNYKDGVKDGKWEGYSDHLGVFSYSEIYTQGKLISGINHSGGKNYEYTQVYEAPQYPGGKMEFYKFIGKNIMYPFDALQRGITGRVLLSFRIEPDGHVSDVVVVTPLYSSIDKEAKRVLEKTKWIGGKNRGMPIGVKYSIPVAFSMKLKY